MGFILACVLFPALAFAQGLITGAVKDATGALLPGVTVEASSPVLIEKVRSVVSDGSGQYRIVDLRPGTYSVTFTLPGFSTFKRDGIELTGSFTATVDAEMKLGIGRGNDHGLRRRRPSSTCSPPRCSACISKDIIDAIPAGRGQSALAVLIPGMTAGGQDVGGSNNQSLSSISIHGGRGTDQRQTVDGLTLRNVAGNGNSTNTVVDVGSSQEMTIDYAAGNAEAITGGVLFNFVPKEGGNRFSGSFFGSQTELQLPEQQLHARAPGAGPAVAEQAQEPVRPQRLVRRPYRQGQAVVLLERAVPAQRELHRRSLGEQERRRPHQVALRGRPGPSDVELPEEQHGEQPRHVAGLAAQQVQRLLRQRLALLEALRSSASRRNPNRSTTSRGCGP